MRRLVVPEPLAAGRRIQIVGDDHHYLARVLRLRPGATVPALDVADRHWLLVIDEIGADRLTAHATEPADHRVTPDHPGPALTGSSAPAFPRVTVYQAIPKGRKLDEPIRALVQAGVTRIAPIVTRRTVVRPDGTGRSDRWQRIAREAVQQSGGTQVVRVDEPRPLTDLTPTDGALSLVLHPEPLAHATLHGYLGVVPSEVELVVGPEGGLAEEELSMLLDRGFRPLWLGPQVLRTESAALFAAAAVRILVLERAHWQPRDELERHNGST